MEALWKQVSGRREELVATCDSKERRINSVLSADSTTVQYNHEYIHPWCYVNRERTANERVLKVDDHFDEDVPASVAERFGEGSSKGSSSCKVARFRDVFDPCDGGDRREEDRDGFGAGPSSANGHMPQTPQTPRPATMSPQTSPRTFAQRNQMEPNFSFNALRPSREWYYLLAGLLTRAVLEGYLTAHWRGIEPLEVLLGVGLGMTPSMSRSNGAGSRPTGQLGDPPSGTTAGRASGGDDLEFKEFDPDDLPDLEEAARILFPSLREPMGGGNTPVYYAREGY
ncbi:hypothetical protein NUW54_g2882 [Trametes sanguinea]|uniref:Uncharacterized protein n=1 Tax=Trametes sanguinea TaxID=158606 RepID=A0ACC1Q2B4_9APHY|nr:hypothetical protein NUW54_g2882 [Trametes sanguinea]